MPNFFVVIKIVLFCDLFTLCKKFVGAIIGLVLSYSKRDWTEVETLSPNIFFLILLPPIIFENGYNLHKVSYKIKITNWMRIHLLLKLIDASFHLSINSLDYFRAIFSQICFRSYHSLHLGQ